MFAVLVNNVKVNGMRLAHFSQELVRTSVEPLLAGDGAHCTLSKSCRWPSLQ